jgi:hypothetical protein
MSPAEIIERASAEGVLLALSPSGRISAKGKPSVLDRWLPEIKQHKNQIISELQLEKRRAKILSILRNNPEVNYAIDVVDADSDPVLVSVGIRKVATFELTIPKKYYDPFSLMELVGNSIGNKCVN